MCFIFAIFIVRNKCISTGLNSQESASYSQLHRKFNAKMYSVSQIAHAYNLDQVRSFRHHVKATGLDKKLPKLMRGRVTIYRKEIHTIMEYLGATPKIKKLYEIPEK